MAFYVIGDTVIDISQIKNEYKYFGSEIHFNDECIASDSLTTYIGQTKNYIFFYKLTSKESLIYPKHKLEKIILVNN